MRLRTTIGLLFLGLILVQSSSAARPLRTGILDPAAFTGANADRSFARTRTTGASIVRVFLVWNAIAPKRPSDATNPEDPAYRWETLDRQMVGAARQQLDPLIYISGSVAWARGPAVNLPGTWPSPLDFGQFARAAARRYSGSFRPAGNAVPLPRVRYWQAWNEPNAGREITPQRQNGRAVSPAHYRRLVNAFADAVHAVNASNLVVAGGLGPFGHNSSDIQVLAPMEFMSALLCVSRRPPHRRTCTSPTRFDVWAHHPYTNGGPTHSAQKSDDVSIGDLQEMRTLLAAAKKAGTIVSRRAPEFWVTEFSWDSSPPDPRGVPAALHARWISEALYRMWSAGVSAVIWFRLQDDPLRETAYQSGFFTATGAAKPSLLAFRFPFVAFRTATNVSVWGRTPSGRVESIVVERQAGNRWTTLVRLRSDREGIFSRRLATPTTNALRARVVGRSDVSRPFSLTVPPDRAALPFGCGGPIPCSKR